MQELLIRERWDKPLGAWLAESTLGSRLARAGLGPEAEDEDV